MKFFINLILVCTILSALVSPAPAKQGPFKISGYYKNLFVTSKTINTKEGFFSDLQRLRLELKTRINDALTANLTYDNDIIINDFSGTSDFDVIRHKNQKELAFWDLDKTLSERKHTYWKHSLYRAYIKYYLPSMQFILGKQAISWSRMRLYYPFDLFNPISVLDIEQDEKIGVDALNLEFYPQSFNVINLIYIPYKNTDKAALGLKLTQKIKDYDIFFIAAQKRKDAIIGLGFDGYLWQAGLRLELTYTKKDNKREFLRSAIGLDHNLTPKLYSVLEYFYNGGAEKDKDLFLNSYEFSREAITMKKHILGAGLEYEISGITKLANYLFYDFEGESIFINPEVKCNIRTNLDLSLGIQFFSGNSESEFANYGNTYYAQMKYFF